MIPMKYTHILSLVTVALSLGSCGNRDFHVEGTITGSADSTLVLEKLDPVAGWLALDSVKLDANGDFSISSPAPDVPEMYRLALGGRYVYLPVDSVETLSLTARLKDFDTGFSLSGTPQAERLTAFEREAHKVEGYANADSVAAFRKRVYTSYLREAKGNILSYYILTRPMGQGWLIDYRDPLYTAVATAFETYKPSDPHTALLVARAREGQAERRRASGKGVRVKASATGMIPISLPGLDGKEVTLQSRLGKGKPVVVAFVAMTRSDAPDINRRLRALYDAGRADVYEVCLDADQFAWRQASRALPWTVVLDPDAERSRAALNYNVGSLPAFFIYNAAGDLVESTGEVDKIASLL